MFQRLSFCVTKGELSSQVQHHIEVLSDGIVRHA